MKEYLGPLLYNLTIVVVFLFFRLAAHMHSRSFGGFTTGCATTMLMLSFVGLLPIPILFDLDWTSHHLGGGVVSLGFLLLVFSACYIPALLLIELYLLGESLLRKKVTNQRVIRLLVVGLTACAVWVGTLVFLKPVTE